VRGEKREIRKIWKGKYSIIDNRVATYNLYFSLPFTPLLLHTIASKLR
jgi:hypothetical protein